MGRRGGREGGSTRGIITGAAFRCSGPSGAGAREVSLAATVERTGTRHGIGRVGSGEELLVGKWRVAEGDLYELIMVLFSTTIDFLESHNQVPRFVSYYEISFCYYHLFFLIYHIPNHTALCLPTTSLPESQNNPGPQDSHPLVT